jgi:hypothetical protein
MKDAFWRIADRLREETGDRMEVHPDSIAEKVFGEAPPWSQA